MSDVLVVMAFIDAYREQDLLGATSLMTDDFTFTSPQDDHLDKATYLAQCFPTAGRFASQETLQLNAIGEDGVFWRYEYELVAGGRYRNCEVLTVRGGQVAAVEVYFGGQV